MGHVSLKVKRNLDLVRITRSHDPLRAITSLAPSGIDIIRNTLGMSYYSVEYACTYLAAVLPTSMLLAVLPR